MTARRIWKHSTALALQPKKEGGAPEQNKELLKKVNRAIAKRIPIALRIRE